MNDILSEPDTRAIEEILMRELDVKREQLTAESRLDQDFAADSLTFTEIIMAIEDHFDLTVSEERWEQVKTVGQLYETVAEMLQARRRG